MTFDELRSYLPLDEKGVEQSAGNHFTQAQQNSLVQKLGGKRIAIHGFVLTTKISDHAANEFILSRKELVSESGYVPAKFDCVIVRYAKGIPENTAGEADVKGTLHVGPVIENGIKVADLELDADMIGLKK